MKKRFRRSAVGVLLLVLVVLLAARVHTLMADPLFDDIASTDSVDALKNSASFNALLVGVDNSGALADAIMLVNVNKTNKQISLLSIPRDTRIYLDGNYCKINSSFSKGVDTLVDEVKKLTGVYVNYYAVISPGTLEAIVDRLGGVEYTVEKDMYYSDPSQQLEIELKAGSQILDGQQAEQYCRYRQYVMGDYERTQAQQRFVKALFEQKLSVKYIPAIYDLYHELEDKVQTNVSLSDILSNIDVVRILSSDGGIACFDAPGKFNDMQKEGVSYYIIKDDDLNELRNLCLTHFSIS